MTWTFPQIFVVVFCMFNIARELLDANAHGLGALAFQVVLSAISYSALFYMLHLGGFW